MPSFRLRTHLLFWFTLITLLLTAAITTLYSLRFKEHALEDLAANGRNITMNTAFSVADALISENYAQMQEFIMEVSSRSEVDAIEVSDTQAQILAASDLNLLGTLMEQDPDATCSTDTYTICIRLDQERKRLVVTTPIKVEGIALGRARVSLSTRPIQAQLAEIQGQALLTGFACWLVTLAFSFLLAKYLSDPVHRFVAATERIRQGDFQVELPAPKLVLELEQFASALAVTIRTIASREEALRASEKKYRLLFERAMEGIFVADGQGRLLDANPAFLAILGYADKELIVGYNLFAEIFDEENFSFFHRQIELLGAVRDFELRLQKNGDEAIVISLACHAVKNSLGEVEKYEGMLRDITLQRKAERELLKMRNYLNNIIESMPSVLVTVDSECLVTQWNSAAAQFTGIPAHAAIGKKICDIAPFFSKYTEQISEIGSQRKPVKLHREHVPQDEEHVYNLTFFPLVANGTAGVAIRLDDITELESKEQQLRQAQKMESIGTLAGGLAHDFNNLLMGILGNVSLLLMKMDETDPVYERLKNIEEYVQRGSDLTKQLLGFARGGKYEVKPTDLAEFTRKSSFMFGRTKKEIRIHHKAPDDLWTVEVDRGQMEQVLINLYVNAWQAMPGGGDLYVSLENTELNVDQVAPHNLKEGKYVVLTITDTGIGMDEATRARIFEPFFTTKELGRGTGLGLASVYGIIRNHGGFILVESEQGIGTTFMIHLPASARPCEMESQSENQVRTGRETILLIDDEEMILEVGSEMLMALGYKVLSAAGGRTGLHIYDQHKAEIDLVILDMVMPDLGGRETFEALKRSNRSIKVVLSSGYSLDGQAKEIMQGGCKGFIQKPFNLAELSRKIREILDSE